MSQLCRGTGLNDIQQMDYQALGPVAHLKRLYLTQFGAFNGISDGFAAVSQ